MTNRYNTAIICVWYKPTEEMMNRWLNMNHPAAYLIVIDNTPEVDLGLTPTEDFSYIALKENRGIALAQNTGIRKAKECGCRNVVFFDQDSDADNKIIERLHDDFECIRNSGIKIGAIGPQLIEKSSGEPYKMGSSTASCAWRQSVDTLISTGLMTSTDVLDDVGILEEDLFIDLVDFEWCWRALYKGYDLFISPSATLWHQVGNGSFSFLGMNYMVSAPIRYYYGYRNTRRMLFRNYVPFKWKVKAAIKNIFGLAAIALKGNFRGRRIVSLKYAIKGIFSK